METRLEADIKGVKADIAHLDRKIDTVVGETSAMETKDTRKMRLL